jgi:hypothetical protein
MRIPPYAATKADARVEYSGKMKLNIVATRHWIWQFDDLNRDAARYRSSVQLHMIVVFQVFEVIVTTSIYNSFFTTNEDSIET